MANTPKPISLHPLTIEQALKKALDAGPMPEKEPKKAPKKSGTSPNVRKRSPKAR